MNLVAIEADPFAGEEPPPSISFDMNFVDLSLDNYHASFREDDCCPCQWGFGSVVACDAENIQDDVFAGKIPIPPCMRTD